MVNRGFLKQGVSRWRASPEKGGRYIVMYYDQTPPIRYIYIYIFLVRVVNPGVTVSREGCVG